MTSFWWIRHAPVVGNDNRCYGNNEVKCDVSDLNSFKTLYTKLPKNSIVYTSSLERTIKTFNALRDIGYKYKHHVIDKRLCEQNLGDYTGMKYKELYNLTKKLNIVDENWLFKSNHIPPNGESFTQLRSKIKSFIKDTLFKKNNNNIIVFSHGGPIRAALAIALNYKNNIIPPVLIDNSKLTRLDYKNKKWQVRCINS